MKRFCYRNLLMTTFFLDGKRESFYACMCTLPQLAITITMSGLNMNFEKTVVVWMDSLEHSHGRFMPALNLNWNPAIFKVLGVVFSTNVHEIVLINYENKPKEMEKWLNAWSRRNITPFGKITVIKTLVIAKITHLVLEFTRSR